MAGLFSRLTENNFRVFLFLAVLGFIVYANSFVAPFFWDDNDNVVNNIYIKSWAYLPKYFSENLIAGAGLASNYWRPLLLISYSLDYHFFGLNKYWWHFVNIFLHIANAFLLYLVLDFLFKKKWFAFLISAIFLVNPLQTDAVTMITARADPLFFFFVLLSIIFYLKSKNFLSIVFFLSALLTKELAVILLPLLLLIEVCFRISGEFSLKKLVLKLLPYFFLAGIYILGRLTVLNFNNTLNFYNDSSLYATSLFVRFLTFSKALLVYFGLLFYPHNLHPERYLEPVTAVSFTVISAFLLIAAMFFWAFLKYKNNKNYLFGSSWFLITLLPTSNIFIPINRPIYEHWLYVPLVGFFIFLITLLEELWFLLRNKINFFRKFSFFLISVTSILYLIFLSVLTVNRNSVWRDPVAFFSNVLKYNRNSLMIWNNLGMAYADASDLYNAETAYLEAIKLDQKKESAPPHHNLGNLYRDRGQFEKAVLEYKNAIAIDKFFYFSYDALIKLEMKQNKQNEAEDVFKKARGVFPDFPDTFGLIKNS